ncbi:hypothetical protein [Nocardia sp. NPDC057030]|uniref:hypothetical protein n=1 Tax=unclassified Nocardia TaxID=2637762 RepID=UPI00362A6D6B
MSIDYGQSAITAFNAAAGAGSINFDPAAVKEAVGLYTQMINGLTTTRQRLEEAVKAQGFGGFQSGQELQSGFISKAREGIDVINQLIEGAMRLQEAYLRAGNLLEDADQKNAAALRFAAQAAESDSLPT